MKNSRQASPKMDTPQMDRLERGENKLETSGEQTQNMQEENLQKTEATAQTSASTINSNYKYDDYDMRLFLQIYAEVAELKTKIKTVALEPITAEQLSIALEGDDSKIIPRKVMIACNLGSRHWVGIAVKITNKQIEAEYMDSIPTNSIPKEIIDQLKNHYGKNISIKLVSRLMQSDSVSCGPLCLKNLSDFAIGETTEQELFPSKESVAPIREQQINDAISYNSDFADKQLNDRSVVASNDIYAHYVEQLNLKNYTNAEIEQITNLVEQYNKIEKPAIKSKMLEAFSNTTTEDHREYFNSIRNLFDKLRKEKDLSSKDSEGIDGMMQIMFGKKLEEAKLLSNSSFKALSTRILSYDALLNLFKKMVIEKDNLEMLISAFKSDIEISKERLEQVADKLKLAHAIYLNIIRIIKSSDTWAEKITTENVLFIFSALTITTSAAMLEAKNIWWQIAGKAISWLGIMASVGVTIPQTKKAFFEDFEATLNNVKDELEEFPEILAMLEKRFKPEDLKKNLNWQRIIAGAASAFILGGVILNLSYSEFYLKLFSIIGAGLASTIGLITSVHNIGKIETGAKKVESIDIDILHAKIRKFEHELKQKDETINELRDQIKSYEQSKKISSTDPDIKSYDAKVEEYRNESPKEEERYKELRQRHLQQTDITSEQTKSVQSPSDRDNTSSPEYKK